MGYSRHTFLSSGCLFRAVTQLEGERLVNDGI